MPKADIDFTDTGSGAGYLTEGIYHVRLTEVEQVDGREYPMWVWTFTSLEPESFGKTTRHTTSLSPKAAYFIRQTLEALGGEVPQSVQTIDTDHYIGCEAMVYVVQDGTFTGRDGEEKPRYKVSRLMPYLGTDAPVPAADPRDDVSFANDDIPF